MKQEVDESLLKKEKLDTKVTEIRSGYLIEKDGKKVKVEVPVEFWTMIADDFTQFSFWEAIKYRVKYVSMPIDDFKIVNKQEIMGFELFLHNSDEAIRVKIYEEGFIRIRDKELRIGDLYTRRYYKEGLKFLRMEDEGLCKDLHWISKQSAVLKAIAAEINKKRNAFQM